MVGPRRYRQSGALEPGSSGRPLGTEINRLYQGRRLSGASRDAPWLGRREYGRYGKPRPPPAAAGWSTQVRDGPRGGATLASVGGLAVARHGRLKSVYIFPKILYEFAAYPTNPGAGRAGVPRASSGGRP